MKNKTLLCSILLTGLVFNSTFSGATENSSNTNRLKFVQTSPEIQNLDIDQLIKIETIRRDYKELIASHREQAELQRKIFDEGLEIDTDEQAIRNAFAPLAQAMEDVAVCQIQMMQEINRVLNGQDPPESMQ